MAKLSMPQAKRQGLLKDRLRLVKRKDSDRYEIAPVTEPLSFDKGFFLFIRACQLLSQNLEGVVIVGLAGPSGAGKTVFTEKVSNFMPGIAAISMDNYNDGSRIIDGNYDDPRLTDYELLLQNINDLKAGKAVDIPIYDFKLSTRAGHRRLEVPSSRIVIIEGTYALSEKLRPLLDLRVSVTGGVHFDLVKRVLRDINRSGQAPEDIIQQVSETVYPMYKAFIEPDLVTAHIRIVNKFNPFSGLQTATYILKSSRTVSEEQIREILSADHTETFEETYDIYLLPPGEDPETCQSYLRMRNRNGRYSLMFEECVTDNPFIISPRITFEASVRLLGGLMALGYTIATILKRVSHVYLDEKICVKIDKMDQLHRKYIQVQGKERALVASIAQKLGLDGSYIPFPYIEQIQLEKLTAEVMALPEDLKAKLRLNDTLSSSPLSYSWIADVKPGTKDLYSKSWTRDSSKKISESMRIEHINKKRGKFKSEHVDGNEDMNHIQDPGSPKLFIGDQGFTCFSEQLVNLNDRIDGLLQRLEDLDSRLFPCNCNAQRLNSAALAGPVNGGNINAYANGSVIGNHSPTTAYMNTTSTAAFMNMPSIPESIILEELRILTRGQCHITTQFEVMSSLLRENADIKLNKYKQCDQRIWWERLVGRMRTNDSGLAIAAGLLAVGVGSLASVVAFRIYRFIDT